MFSGPKREAFQYLSHNSVLYFPVKRLGVDWCLALFDILPFTNLSLTGLKSFNLLHCVTRSQVFYDAQYLPIVMPRITGSMKMIGHTGQCKGEGTELFGPM